MTNPDDLNQEFSSAEAKRPPASPASPTPWQGYYPDARTRSPIVAAVLSVMPGLGQIYVGYYQHGFVNILIVGSLISFLSSGGIDGLEPLAGIFLAFFWLYNIVDAARRAAQYNQALAGLEPGELPEHVSLPGEHGSLFGGVVLLVLGMIALSHTLFNVPLDWLEDWWPAGLILVGAFLVFKSIQTRK